LAESFLPFSSGIERFNALDIVMAQFEQLENLAKLAGEKSSDDRRQLLREVTDLLLEDPDVLAGEAAEPYVEILCQIVSLMEAKIRQHLSTAMSQMGGAPKELVVHLANDEIEVARPVLMKSNLLADKDLLAIVKEMTQEHMLAISGRETVSTAVSDGLVARGDDTVLQSLATNSGAALSKQGMEKLAVRSEANKDLCSALLERDDFPEDLEKKLLEHVSDTLKEHVRAESGDADADLISDFLAESKKFVLSQREPPKEQNPEHVEKFIKRKELLGQLDIALLLKLLHDGKVSEFLAGIARLGGVDLPTARRILFDTTGEKLAVICKAVGFERDEFTDLLSVSDSIAKRTKEENVELLYMYDRIPVASAQRAVRFLRTRSKLK